MNEAIALAIYLSGHSSKGKRRLFSDLLSPANVLASPVQIYPEKSRFPEPAFDGTRQKLRRNDL
jgi:hypothetical protein